MLNYHVLIAEDEDAMRKTMSMVLKAAGCKVSQAQNGQEALSLIKAAQTTDSPVQILITDVQMPHLTGEELLDELKKQKISIPSLAITGFGDKEMVVRLMRRGCDEYIDKPFTSDQFEKTVMALIWRTETARKESCIQSADRENRQALLSRELDLLKEKYVSLKTQIDGAIGEYKSMVDIDAARLSVNLAFRNRPLRDLGGDFLAAHNTPQGCDVLVADVAGHDLAASFHTIALKMFFDDHCQNDKNGSFLLELLNRALIEHGNNERLVTAVLLRINLNEQWAEVTSAGHPPIVYISTGDRIGKQVYLSGHMLGMFPDARFETKRIFISPGDRFFLYSDGLVNVGKTDGKTGMRQRILSLGVERLVQHHAPLTLENSVDSIWDDIAVFCRYKYEDDALLAGVEIPEH